MSRSEDKPNRRATRVRPKERQPHREDAADASAEPPTQPTGSGSGAEVGGVHQSTLGLVHSTNSVTETIQFAEHGELRLCMRVPLGMVYQPRPRAGSLRSHVAATAPRSPVKRARRRRGSVGENPRSRPPQTREDGDATPVGAADPVAPGGDARMSALDGTSAPRRAAPRRSRRSGLAKSAEARRRTGRTHGEDRERAVPPAHHSPDDDGAGCRVNVSFDNGARDHAAQEPTALDAAAAPTAAQDTTPTETAAPPDSGLRETPDATGTTATPNEPTDAAAATPGICEPVAGERAGHELDAREARDSRGSAC